jgi:hypothetical protein
LNVFQPLSGQNLGEYLSAYLNKTPSQLTDPKALSNCSCCALKTTDQFWSASEIAWDERWRNFGIVWAYILFNIATAMMVYYVFRVLKWKPATLNEGPQRWSRLGRWFAWAGIWVEVLVIGTIGEVVSHDRKSGNTISHANWDENDSW